MSGFALRDEQAHIVEDYRGGYAAIAAVPGAGKTTTLSALAAKLIGEIGPRQRVVIVTYQNAAVANFQRAVTQRLHERGMPPRGFVVRTLHSLANEVLQSVRHRAELDTGVRIVDDSDAKRIIDDLTLQMKQRHRESLRLMLVDEEAEVTSRWPQGDTRLFEEIVRVALRELRTTSGLDIDAFRERHAGYGRWLPFVLDVCCEFQQALREQGLLDYDGLIVRAVDALERDEELRLRLRRRWPFILEDEAQDSTPLLERMLRLIAGEPGNLMRVGDPNQSILSTFTSSDVEGLRRWMADEQVATYHLTSSSRSTRPIIDLANRFVISVRQEFPEPAVRDVALEHQLIQPVYGQRGLLVNPAEPRDAGRGVTTREFETTQQEREAVIGRALAYLRRYPDRTAAILVGSRENGYEYATDVTTGESGHEPFPDSHVIRLLGDQDGRQVGLIGRLLPIIDFLTMPHVSSNLFEMLTLWSPLGSDDRVVQAVRAAHEDSRFTDAAVLYPEDESALSVLLRLPVELQPEEEQTLSRLRSASGWLANRLARPAELLSLISATIGIDDQERLLMDAVITTVESTEIDPSKNRLEQLRATLKELHQRQRRLRGTHDEHEIKIEPGTLTISTRHQAKGLEWDVVFAVGCDDFWFKGDLTAPRRNQRAVLGFFDPVLAMRAELEFAVQGRGRPSDDDIRELTDRVSIAEIAEGLRILYVTITRAKQAIWLSWHRVGDYQGQRSERKQSPVFPLLEDLVREVQEEAAGVAAD